MRRCWWALVVLAAVFAMHGLQCLSDDSHSLTGHGVGTAVMWPSVPATFGASDLAATSGEPAAPHATEHAAPASPQPASDDASSPLPADFWAVCLAVLSAGLALLAAALLRPRSVARPRRPGPFAPTWFCAPALRRPPDLFALCVLRN